MADIKGCRFAKTKQVYEQILLRKQDGHNLNGDIGEAETLLYKPSRVSAIQVKIFDT